MAGAKDRGTAIHFHRRESHPPSKRTVPKPQILKPTLTLPQCVTITAVITASFSWNTVASAHWTAPGFWYASLTFSICGILLAAQQVAAFSLLGPFPENPSADGARKAILRYLPHMLRKTSMQVSHNEARNPEYDLGEWTVRWKMVFTWQVPMMFMAYSFLCYILGLTIMACSPLLQRQPWGPESNVSGCASSFHTGARECLIHQHNELMYLSRLRLHTCLRLGLGTVSLYTVRSWDMNRWTWTLDLGQETMILPM